MTHKEAKTDPTGSMLACFCFFVGHFSFLVGHFSFLVGRFSFLVGHFLRPRGLVFASSWVSFCFLVGQFLLPCVPEVSSCFSFLLGILASLKE